MNRSLLHRLACFVAFALWSNLTAGTTFTYHGTLLDGGKAADGSYDLELTLYISPTGGHVIAGPMTVYGVPVHAGTFATQVDFGELNNAPADAWLAVKVRAVGETAFAPLGSRSQVTATTAPVCPGAWTLAGNASNPAGSYLGTADTQPLIFEVNALRAGLFTPSGDPLTTAPNVVFGSSANTAASGAGGQTISGGGDTAMNCGPSGTSTCGNVVSGLHAVVAGGFANTALLEGVVGGGHNNAASGSAAVIGGGINNTASGVNASISGGIFNLAGGYSAAIGGGYNNSAGGDYSFAAGNTAKVRDATQAGSGGGCSTNNTCGDYGTFVWSDSAAFPNPPFTSTGPNEFLVNAHGGMAVNGTPVNHNDELTIYGNGNGSNNVDVDLFPFGATLGFEFVVSGGSGFDPTFHIDETDGAATFTQRITIASPSGFIGLNGAGTGYPLEVGTTTSDGAGAHLTAGGVWTTGSSRLFKEDFREVDAGNILAKVLELPVRSWFYKNDHREGRHLGPVAEDFAALFGLGNDEQYIGTVDEEGVALAAIQGLNAKEESDTAATRRELQEKDDYLRRENAELRTKLDEVMARLAKLESGRRQ